MTLVISSNLIACALSPPNAEVCLTLASGDAFCTKTLSNDERMIGRSEWVNMQVGRFSLSADDFAKYQGFIDEACIKYSCSDKEKDLKKKMRELKAIYDVQK